MLGMRMRCCLLLCVILQLARMSESAKRVTDSRGGDVCMVNYRKNLPDPSPQAPHVVNRTNHSDEYDFGTPVSSGGRTERSSFDQLGEPPARPDEDNRFFLPYFDNSTAMNVTAQQGTTAYLHCRIGQLGNRVVSWVRQEDIHILTVGMYTYTSDFRYTSIHKDATDDWSLEIKYVKKKDAGVYECQLSTEPKLCLAIRLRVVVARSKILEGKRLYIGVDSAANLTCLIREYALDAGNPVYVFWYHNNKPVGEEAQRGGRIKVTTEIGRTTVSVLHIARAIASDSGKYSCQASYAEPVNTTLLVLDGEKPAAMQHDRSISHRMAKNYQMVSAALSLVLFLSLTIL